MSATTTASISLRDLKVEFVSPGKTIHAVNGVDLEVARGDCTPRKRRALKAACRSRAATY